MKKSSTIEPAIFYDVNGTYRADTCEPLKNAAETGSLSLDAYGRNCYPGHKLPAQMMPELCLAGVWDAKINQAWGLGKHRNEGIELGYLSKGRLDFLVENNNYNLSSGSLTITRPWQLHKVGNPNVSASRMHWLIIDLGVRRPNEQWKWPDWLVFAPNDIARLTELLRYNEQPVWKGNDNLERCFEKIAETVQCKDPQSAQTRLRLHINELLLEVYELLQSENIVLDVKLASTARSVEMFLDGLCEHLDYQWTLDSMAKHCDLGRSMFSEHCKAITNMTPTDYLTHCRIEKAKSMLANKPDKNITDIAFACGFETSQYFATVFKKKTNQSPTQFRQAKRSQIT